MNQFKRDLNRELQVISLSQELKQQIATKAKAEKYSQKKRVHWQYRFVLTAFMILSLSLGYLLWQQGRSVGRLQGAAPIEIGTTTNWSMLNHDFFKIILLISFFIILRLVIKRLLQKSGKGLPVCVECGEEWHFREALKQCMKNSNIICPYCGHKQYRTKKSSLKANLLNIPIPCLIIIIQLFDNTLLGVVVYLSCAAYLVLSLNPYFMELQEKDPINEFLG
ncbi:hypothetical protein JSQ81_13115 [Sporosarcina sp. Marseille-Q4063]|uniref:TIGR04104 family putative zinc finger protein n=1 Tax=Sporosarcina sp. Marseille-Q4063 TaxID=2810514 RepID=UPI001BAF1206|nr:TIGR04104 family putative zinc finger protein [Sporosarcina sp. Marseille-Q4063]QUW20757.1 hypothetical protein JSQ81_13115 [Sporosarcina sp. Marseille-Q4063]